jgi:hypothetical protein
MELSPLTLRSLRVLLHEEDLMYSYYKFIKSEPLYQYIRSKAPEFPTEFTLLDLTLEVWYLVIS